MMMNMPGQGQDRPFIEEEFVGRDEILENLLKVVRQESKRKIVLMLGQFGIGKTWFVQKLRADGDDATAELAYVDFGTPPLGKAEWGYLDIVEALRAQLGAEAFAPVDALIAQMRTESAGQGMSDAFATQMGAGPPVPGGTPVGSVPGESAPAIAPPAAVPQAVGGDFVGGDKISAEVGNVGEGAQVVVGSNVVMAQGDVNYYVVNQMPGRDDQQVQAQYQARITEALLGCLQTVAAKEKLTIILDAWLKASTPTRDWLQHGIAGWIRDGQLLDSALVVCDDSAAPELQGRHPSVIKVSLPGLSEAQAITYWVDKRKLDEAKASMVAQLSMGHPLTLSMIADQHALAADDDDEGGF
jgi:hypothetical protein